jgi:hypothetical protein
VGAKGWLQLLTAKQLATLTPHWSRRRLHTGVDLFLSEDVGHNQRLGDNAER